MNDPNIAILPFQAVVCFVIVVCALIPLFFTHLKP